MLGPRYKPVNSDLVRTTSAGLLAATAANADSIDAICTQPAPVRNIIVSLAATARNSYGS